MNWPEISNKILVVLAIIAISVVVFYSLHQVAYEIAMEFVKWVNLIPNMYG